MARVAVAVLALLQRHAIPVAPYAMADDPAELQPLADRERLDRTIVVQSQVAVLGEAFVGVRTGTSLGPLIMFGLGGIHVELTRLVEGRMLPMSARELDVMLDDLGGTTVFAELRDLVTRFAALELLRADWASAFELNPVICAASGCVAAALSAC